MACHDMCINTKAPEGIEHLLGLGAKYCVKRTKLSSAKTEKMMERLRRNIRWKYIFRHAPDDNEYIPGLYTNSERNPDEAEKSIEICLNKFEEATTNERKQYARQHISLNQCKMAR